MWKRLLEKWFNLEPEVCLNCEFLKSLLETERREKDNLLKMLTHKTTEVVPEKVKEENFQPIGKRQLPWAVVRQQLEQRDRLQAENDRANKIAAMEKEVSLNG